MKKIYTLILSIFITVISWGQCNHTFRMADSYGDGWNGSSVDVTVNGTAVLTAQEPVSGLPPEDVTFTASTGDVIALANWVTGSWLSEVSWELLDGGGTVIASGVHGDVAGGAGNCPSCTPPTALTTANVTDVSADLSWTAGGTETAWNIEYGAAGFAQGSGTTVAVTATSYSFTGLTANTSYDMYVQSDCGSGVVSGGVLISVRTSLPAVQGVNCTTGNPAFIFSDDMDVNNGWTGDIGTAAGTWDFATSGVGGNSSGTGPSAPASGSTYAEYEASGSASSSTIIASMVSPMIDLSTALGAAQLTFYMHAYGSAIGTLNVGVGASATGPFTTVFTSSGQIQTAATDPWSQVGVDLTSYLGQQVYVEFSYGADGSGWYGDLAIDLVQVESCQNCPAPSALTIANVTDVSADLSWTAGGTETAWNVEYGPSGFSQGSGTTVPVTATSYSITGLTANTSYDVYVQADCGGGTSGFIQDSITTLITPGTCGYFTAELFDSFGDGWNGNGLVVSINGTVTDTLATTSADGTNAVTTLIPVNTGDIVDFDYVVDAYGLGGNTWIGENSYNIYDDGGNTIAAAAAGSGTTGGPASSLGLVACPTCPAPNSVVVSNILGVSVDLAWTAGGTETAWNLDYQAAGDTVFTSVAVTTNPFTLTGLSPATNYICHIQADCGNGDISNFSLPVTSFTTSCPASYVAPFLENFDAGTPPCWTQLTSDAFDWTLDANGTPSGTTGPSDDVTGGGNYMYIETSSPRAPGDSAMLLTTSIDLSALSIPELRFFSHMYGASIGELSIHIDDGVNPLTMIWQLLGDQGNQWDERTVDLSAYAGGTVQFIILGVVGDNGSGVQYWGDAAIDNFQVRDLPANDLSVVAGAVPSGCELTATETLEAWVVNAGLVAETGFAVEYSVNGGTAVSETITSSLNAGDTLMHMFTTTADMSADGMYVVDFSVVLPTDVDTTNNHLIGVMAGNYITPAAPTTNGDTICNGDTAMVTSDAGYTSWYDAATGGNLVGEGAAIDVTPTATTSYYAEAIHTTGHSENFDSYNVGDYIVASDPSNWDVWPGGTPGGAYDMQVTDVQGNGGNSLQVFNSDGTDIVLEFGEAISTGHFYYSMDMFIVNEGYINFQEDTTIGVAWNMSVTFIAGVIDITVDGASVLTGSYNGSNPAGNTVWNTFKFDCDYSTGTWEVFADGVSQGTFVNPDPVASVNIYPGAGVEYYLDNVEWGKLGCPSTTRTEAVVTVEDCSSIGELSFKDLNIYPNPNNGLFTITNSQEITDVIITDLQGKIVYNSRNINLNKVNVELNNLERGMYMINIETNDGMITKAVTLQ